MVPDIHATFLGRASGALRAAAGAAVAPAEPFTLRSPEAHDDGWLPVVSGALGSFPYVWQDPRTTDFNVETWKWVNTHVRDRETPEAPLVLFESLTNQTDGLISKVSYRFTVEEQQALEEAEAAARTQQLALLLAWNQRFEIPPVPYPIDDVVTTILQTWAPTFVTLEDVYESSDVPALFPDAPPDVGDILVALEAWVDAVESVLPLVQRSTLFNGLIQHSLLNLQLPDRGNGSIKTSDGLWRPGFEVSPSVADIERALRGDARAEVTVQIDPSGKSPGSAGVDVLEGLLGTQVGPGDAFTDRLFRDAIGSDPTSVTIQADGIAEVSIAPTRFDKDALTGWLFPGPIRAASQNPGEIGEGFFFRPWPLLVDFSTTGNTGYISDLLISTSPHVVLRSSGPFPSTLDDAFSAPFGMSVFGQTVGRAAAPTPYSATKGREGDLHTLTLRPTTRGAVGLDERAYVLGGKATFPYAATLNAEAPAV